MYSSDKAAVILLAAGYSSRMQEFKPLMEIGGVSLLERLIRSYEGIDTDIYVVVGRQQEKLEPLIKRCCVNIVENPLFAQGMFSSIQAGASAVLKGKYKQIFVHPVDIPLIRPSSLQAILESSRQQPDKIIYPVFNHKRGHPVLIPTVFSSGIAEWQGEGGLKSYLTRFSDKAIEIPVADRFVNCDLDTPQDYQKMLADFENYTVPNGDECEALLKEIYNVPLPVYEHCRAVAEVALDIGNALKAKVPELEIRKIESAARLHDLAKVQGDHSRRGGEILATMGFSGISAIVAQHTDLESQDKISLESKIVFIADKYVSGKQRIELLKRFAEARNKHGFSAEAQARIVQRQETALKIKGDLESILGFALEKIVLA
jgi:molybdenum cofactor cytidylyltransferase